jgi:hypothetical protein
MATWTEFIGEAPKISEMAERRLAATGLMMLATLRREGFPLVGLVEPEAFDIDLLGASSVSVADDAMYVKTWKPGKGVSLTERRE